MRQGYEKAVIMFNKLGNPSLFITFTGNPKWPEITEWTERGGSWADNFDIAVRVFFMKFALLKKLLFKDMIFGKVSLPSFS